MKTSLIQEKAGEKTKRIKHKEIINRVYSIEQ
jgi:hypothetical protein